MADKYYLATVDAILTAAAAGKRTFDVSMPSNGARPTDETRRQWANAKETLLRNHNLTVEYRVREKTVAAGRTEFDYVYEVSVIDT